MASFAAFGRSSDAQESGGLERVLAALRASYESALQVDGDGRQDDAETMYEDILGHALLAGDITQDRTVPRSALILKALVLKNLGALHVAASRFVQGLDCYVRACNTMPDGWADPTLLSNVGGCARKATSMALARQCFERCVRLEPDNLTAVTSLIDVLADCGDEDAHTKMSAYGEMLCRRQWAPGMMSMPVLPQDVPIETFCKRRRLIHSVLPEVEPLECTWTTNCVTWEALIEYLMGQVDVHTAEVQRDLVLTRPLIIKILPEEDDQPPAMSLVSSPLPPRSPLLLQQPPPSTRPDTPPPPRPEDVEPKSPAHADDWVERKRTRLSAAKNAHEGQLPELSATEEQSDGASSSSSSSSDDAADAGEVDTPPSVHCLQTQRMDSVLSFLDRVSPGESIQVNQGQLVYSTWTTPPVSPPMSPVIGDDTSMVIDRLVDATDAVVTFVSRIAGAASNNSGLAAALRALWRHLVTQCPLPTDVAPARFRTLYAQLCVVFADSIQQSHAELLFLAELFFDHARHLRDTGRGDESDEAMSIAQTAMHQLGIHLPASCLDAEDAPSTDDIALRTAWLRGTWGIWRRTPVYARRAFKQCADMIAAGHPETSYRPHCAYDRDITVDSVACKMHSILLWASIESVLQGESTACAEFGAFVVRDDVAIWGDIPVGTQLVSALAAFIAQCPPDSMKASIAAARTVIAIVPTAFTTEIREALLPNLVRCLERLGSTSGLDEADAAGLSFPPACARALLRALAMCVALADFQDLDPEFTCVTVLALVNVARQLDQRLVNDVSAQMELFCAGHTLLSKRAACCARDGLYLRTALEDLLYAPGADTIPGRFTHIGACYSCLFGCLDPRYVCHRGVNTISLPDTLDARELLRLFEFALHLRRYPAGGGEGDQSAGQELLEALRDPIGMPGGLRPAYDFVSEFIQRNRRTCIPPVVVHDGDLDLYGRYYCEFANCLVQDNTLCSFATRISSSMSTKTIMLATELLHTELRLHPSRPKAWYQYAWMLLQQRNTFLHGVQSTITVLLTSGGDIDAASKTDVGDQFQRHFAPLFQARVCFEHALLLLDQREESVPELSIVARSNDDLLSSACVLQDMLFIDLRILELMVQLRMMACGTAGDAALRETFCSVVQDALSREDLAGSIRRTLDRLPRTPRLFYLRALALEYAGALHWIDQASAELLECYQQAATTIPDALYAVHALRLDLALRPDFTDFALLERFAFQSNATGEAVDRMDVLNDVARAMTHCCELDPDFFRPALRLCQLAFVRGAPEEDRSLVALHELDRFVSDKTRARRARARKGSLLADASDGDFVRAVSYDPQADFADNDCLQASLALIRSLRDFEQLESIYYHGIKSRKDRQASLLYASALVDTFGEWSLRAPPADVRDAIFKRSFECCLDLMAGKRNTVRFVPALLVLPFRIGSAYEAAVKAEAANSDGDAASRDQTVADDDHDACIILSDLVDALEVRRARDWCAELQCARSIRTALHRMAVPPGTYNLRDHLLRIGAPFPSLALHR